VCLWADKKGTESRIRGSHGGDYEDGCFLCCSAVQTGMSLPTFKRSLTASVVRVRHHHQPTKKLTKGRVKRRREASSRAIFVSCVRNTLPEMVNVALNCNGGCAYGNGVLSWQKALTYKAVGQRSSIRQIALYEKDFGWMVFWELEQEVLGPPWPMASATWGGGGHFGRRPP
jgi:hypothetical protein